MRPPVALRHHQHRRLPAPAASTVRKSHPFDRRVGLARPLRAIEVEPAGTQAGPAPSLRGRPGNAFKDSCFARSPARTASSPAQCSRWRLRGLPGEAQGGGRPCAVAPLRPCAMAGLRSAVRASPTPVRRPLPRRLSPPADGTRFASSGATGGRQSWGRDPIRSLEGACRRPHTGERPTHPPRPRRRRDRGPLPCPTRNPPRCLAPTIGAGCPSPCWSRSA